MEKRLHISHDDKFIDAFIELCDQVGVQNHTFLIYTLSEQDELRYVKSPQVRKEMYGSPEFFAAVGEAEDAPEVIYVHYLSAEMVDFLLRFQGRSRIVWMFWGADLFDHAPFNKRFLEPLTRKLFFFDFRKQWQQRTSLLGLLRQMRRQLLHGVQEYRKRSRLRSAIKKIDYFAHYLEADYLQLIAEFPAKIQWLPFTYGYMPQVVGTETEPVFAGERMHIWIGNSAHPANNHLDAFECLSGLEPGDKKIYCPLSYSGTKDYIAGVAEAGVQRWDGAFVPMQDFLPKNEYRQLMESIAVGIMFHKRSQAGWNVLLMLWQGVRVYMHEESAFFSLLRELGTVVFSLQSDFDPSGANTLRPLGLEEIAQNRRILSDFFGTEQTVSRFQHLLTI